MYDHNDTLLPSGLLNPIWEDIRKLESQGNYKEAFLYLRSVTNEINSLNLVNISICCLLDRPGTARNGLLALLSMVIENLEPIEECSNLMYLESLRMIMESVLRAIELNASPSEIQSTISELCEHHNDRLFSQTDLAGFDVVSILHEHGCHQLLH